jgi:hypothetical protein
VVELQECGHGVVCVCGVGLELQGCGVGVVRECGVVGVYGVGLGFGVQGSMLAIHPAASCTLWVYHWEPPYALWALGCRVQV